MFDGVLIYRLVRCIYYTISLLSLLGLFIFIQTVFHIIPLDLIKNMLFTIEVIKLLFVPNEAEYSVPSA